MTDATAFPIFTLSSAGVQATAQLRGGQFVVLAGSDVRMDGASGNHSYTNLRPNLIDQGEIALNDQGAWIFTRDTAFSSPSAAAVAVLGRAANGRITWKVEGSDTTYGEWADTHPGVLKPAEPELVHATWKPFFRELAAKLLGYKLDFGL